MAALDSLLRPRSVAIVGASSDTRKTAGKPLAYLKKHGYAGTLMPVNPKASHICDVPCYPDIEALPEAPDVAMVMLGAEKAVPAVQALAKLGTRNAIVLASGYAELGPQGAQLQDALKRAAGSMRLLGPNTIGLVNLTDGITLSASSALEIDAPVRGNIALVSQSGGILGALLSRASALGVGFSKLVSTSNEADLDLTDLTDALIDDEATSVIALYMETLRNPARFRQVARRAHLAGKPIVVFKVGRSESGARSAASHTGALAGTDSMYDALFAETQVVRARQFADLLTISMLLSSGRRLNGNRIAILTSTGGAGTLIADSLGVQGLEIPLPDTATAQSLRNIQTGNHAALDRNPIDVTLAGLEPTLLKRSIEILLQSDGYDAVVAILGSSALAMPDLMADAIRACMRSSDKPVVAYVSPHAPHIVARLIREGIPAFAEPEACATAIRAMLAPTAREEALAQDTALPMPSMLPALHGSLDEAQAKALFRSFGIPATREMVVTSAEAAQAAASKLGGAVALKILSGDITHKSDMGGVALNLDANTIAAALREMQGKLALKAPRFLVQEMVPDGVEMILGVRRDAVGTAILLGMGGVNAELLQDTALVMQPLDRPLHRGEALRLAQRLKMWPLLDGYRGKAPKDTEALVTAILRFSGMVHCLGDQLLEAEINPVFVRDRGRGVMAADGVVVLAAKDVG